MKNEFMSDRVLKLIIYTLRSEKWNDTQIVEFLIELTK